MKENSNGTDTDVGSIENSVEEAIERLEYIDRAYNCNNYYSTWDLKCIEILLSDYKKVLEENEDLKEKERKIYNEVQENLSFEKLLRKQKENIDEFNQGRFHVAQTIYDILSNVESER